MLVTYFLLDLFRDGEAIHASIDERPRVSNKDPEALKISDKDTGL
jgi:hypothetical protein